MTSIASLILRLMLGTLLMGHGGQKLFGWFEGPGLEGTTKMVASKGLQPAPVWARAGALGEFGGGLLTVLGLLNPLGPLGVIGAMAMAAGKFHWGKPIWATKGGAELPLTNLAIALALALTGPGRYSLDHVLGLGLPRRLLIPGLLGVAAVTALGISQQPQPAPSEEASAAGQPEAPQAMAVPARPAPPAAETPPGRVTQDLAAEPLPGSPA